MDKKKLVSYCGVYCNLCGARNSTPKKANELLKALKNGGIEDWGPSINEFDHFWKMLKDFSSNPDEKCCKMGKCGHPACAIRNCAIQKKVESCPLCDEYPCDKILRFSKSEPLLIFDGNRIREIGIDAWIVEQEKRLNGGFEYDCIRCGKPDIPLDE